MAHNQDMPLPSSGTIHASSISIETCTIKLEAITNSLLRIETKCHV